MQDPESMGLYCNLTLLIDESPWIPGSCFACPGMTKAKANVKKLLLTVTIAKAKQNFSSRNKSKTRAL